MNFKRHKPRTKVHCAYNYIGNSKRAKDLAGDWKSVPAKYPSWYCKRRKGKHVFVLMKEEAFWIIPGIWQTFKCSSCGKKKLKHLHALTNTLN